MTEGEFFQALEEMGLERTGLPPTRTGCTIWRTKGGQSVTIPSPDLIEPEDRKETIDWHRKSLGLDPNFPYGGGGVH